MFSTPKQNESRRDADLVGSSEKSMESHQYYKINHLKKDR